VEQSLRQTISDAVQQANASAPPRNGSPMITADVKLIGSRPAAELPENSRLLQLMRAVDAHLNNPSRIHRASTDANVPISLGRDALAIGAGGTGGGAHTLHEWYDPRGRDLGLKRILLALVAMAS
jgi:di/tripeptidase